MVLTLVCCLLTICIFLALLLYIWLQEYGRLEVDRDRWKEKYRRLHDSPAGARSRGAGDIVIDQPGSSIVGISIKEPAFVRPTPSQNEVLFLATLALIEAAESNRCPRHILMSEEDMKAFGSGSGLKIEGYPVLPFPRVVAV